MFNFGDSAATWGSLNYFDPQYKSDVLCLGCNNEPNVETRPDNKPGYYLMALENGFHRVQGGYQNGADRRSSRFHAWSQGSFRPS